MRFDFLSTLVFQQNALPSGNTEARPVVVYSNDSAGNAIIQLAGQSLTGTSADQNNTMPAAYATIRKDGTVPAVPFRKAPNQVTGSLGLMVKVLIMMCHSLKLMLTMQDSYKKIDVRKALFL